MPCGYRFAAPKPDTTPHSRNNAALGGETAEARRPTQVANWLRLDDVSRIVLALVLAAATVYILMRLAAGVFDRETKPVAGRALPALDPADIEEPAAIAQGPERGYGVLRLTPSQLIFAANSGRVLTIERLEITGATTTRDLPDHTSARPVLAVSTRDAVHYFAVNDPVGWEVRLL